MYQEARHEPLIEAEWQQESALGAIDRIVRDTHARFDPQKLWPIHPLDKLSDNPTEPFKMLYFGAAGVIWALDYLNVVGATAMKRDYAELFSRSGSEKSRRSCSSRWPTYNSYLMGDVGISTGAMAPLPERCSGGPNLSRSRGKHNEPGAGTHVGRAWNHVGGAFYARVDWR